VKLTEQFFRSLLYALILVGGILLLTACGTLGPDYEEPDIEWLQDWQPAAYGMSADKIGNKQLDLHFWWRRFNDPVLNQLMAMARQENLPLRIAGLRVFESRALAGIAGSNLYPQVQQLAGSASYVNSQFHGGETPVSNQRFTSYGLGFNAGWELDFWGRFQRGIESADAAFFASIANQQDMQVLVTAQVADLYFAYRVTEARIAIARKNAEIQKRSFEITEKLFNSGEQSELDFQQAKTQYLATLSSIPQLEITLNQIRNGLAVLLGRAPGAIAELVVEDYKLPVVSADSARSIPTQLLSRRPDIRAAAWNIAAQSAQIGIAEADYYPAISLLGSIGWSGSSLNGAADKGSLLLGPALQWNIFDYGRIENNVRVQDARLQQLIEAYRDTALQAAREVDDAAYSLKKTVEQQVLVDKALAASERALELANARYREGYADFQRVLEAQRAMFSQADRQLLTRQNQIAAVISLYKSLGGGWIDIPVEQLVPAQVRKSMQERSDWGGLLTAPLTDTSMKPDSGKEKSQDD
jgi:NodT family efflux transporter outer membrane factor (OMF) lipoprotein